MLVIGETTWGNAQGAFPGFQFTISHFQAGREYQYEASLVILVSFISEKMNHLGSLHPYGSSFMFSLEQSPAIRMKLKADVMFGTLAKDFRLSDRPHRYILHIIYIHIIEKYMLYFYIFELW